MITTAEYLREKTHKEEAEARCRELQQKVRELEAEIRQLKSQEVVDESEDRTE